MFVSVKLLIWIAEANLRMFDAKFKLTLIIIQSNRG